LDAVSYLRRSGAVATGAADISLPGQQSAIEAMAARFGDTISTEFSDSAKSGGTTKREGYQALLSAVASGSVSAVYAYALTRLTRSLPDLMDLKRLCEANGVVIRTAQENIDTSNASGRGFMNIIGAVAEMEREWAQERNKRAAQTRRERGMASGRQVYGTQPGEDPQVVKDALKQAGTFAGAARLLNERGVPTRLGRANGWTHATVAGIIRYHYPELAPDTQKRQGAAPIGGALFSGLLTCHCGTTLTPSRREGKVRGMYCRNSYAIENHGKTFVTDAAIRPWAEAESAKYQPQGIAIRGSNDKERRDLEGRKERLVDALADGTITKEQLRSRVAGIDSRLAELDKADRTLAALIPMPIGIDWSKPDDEVNDQLRRVWSEITLDRDMKPVSVTWRVPDWLWDEAERDAHTAQLDAEAAAADKAGA
jgi:DNA invertase Pin-like site-specific DNA recombinase